MIEHNQYGTVVSNDILAYTYEERLQPTGFSQPIIPTTEYNFGDYMVHPYGIHNNMPEEIRDVIQKNYLAPGLLKIKAGLLWGSGPRLFKTRIENGKEIKELVEDKEVMQWLESWDYEQYLLNSCVEYNHIEGTFTRIYLNKGSRISKGKIAKIEHIPSNMARLATHRSNKTRQADSIIITDYQFRSIQAAADYKVYPLFKYNNPLEHKVSGFYSNMYSFCTDYYTVPDLYGSLEWLRRSTNVPLIFKALSENSLNVKYHIISPGEYWEKKREQLQDDCTKRGVLYTETMLNEYRNRLLDEIAKVLSSDMNAGKFWHTTKTFTVDGTNLIEHGWEIKAIDQNIKEFVEAQIKISQRADYALSGGIGVHAALGNISDSGKANGGSEQIYALKNYLFTGVNIPEMIICKPVNYAIKANWPDKNIKIGFLHQLPEKEEDISPAKRIKNAEA
ncbi:hypothetical protein [Myroides odoratimimus]|uniref:Uncharacterized protein n=1 Tax=Myroides odoratimimus CIP 101113 TaxID=883154 RepID=A0AAV3F528_9FLAO|nr:hypothetical protein [Myroides odoratimimus]EHO13814.1 hypothetical protein HMPREF9715_00888 [Myroides odoratimimus CIP 101113]